MNQRTAFAQRQDADDGIPLMTLWRAFKRRAAMVVAVSGLVGVIAFGVASQIPPTFTAHTTFLPPQQQGSGNAALAALGSFGALAGISGAGGKSSADQFIAFMQSNRVLDEVIDKYNLIELYKSEFRMDARRILLGSVMMSVGKKDGLVTVSVDDKDPRRAADIANEFIERLRGITNTLAVSEAQQRRLFFQQQLDLVKKKLTDAQVALQTSGFSAGALKAEPKAAAEGFARTRSELTAAEIKLQSLRQMLSDRSPEVVQQAGMVAALRVELGRIEQKDVSRGDIEYIGKFREYKYQEALFDLLARQFEMARVDESREGALIQVLDIATPPERKSKPQRGFIALSAAALSFLVLSVWVVFQGVRESV